MSMGKSKVSSAALRSVENHHHFQLGSLVRQGFLHPGLHYHIIRIAVCVLNLTSEDAKWGLEKKQKPFRNH